MWFNDVPAVAIANASRDRGIYESEIFTEKLLEVINNHDPESTSLFLYVRDPHHIVGLKDVTCG